MGFELQLADTILRLRNDHLDHQIAEITHQAAQPGTPDEKKLEFLQTRQGLRESKRGALAPRVVDDPPPESDVSPGAEPGGDFTEVDE